MPEFDAARQAQLVAEASLIELKATVAEVSAVELLESCSAQAIRCDQTAHSWGSHASTHARAAPVVPARNANLARHWRDTFHTTRVHTMRMRTRTHL